MKLLIFRNIDCFPQVVFWVNSWVIYTVPECVFRPCCLLLSSRGKESTAQEKKAVLDDFFMVSDSGKHAYRVLNFRFCVGYWFNNFRQDDF